MQLAWNRRGTKEKTKKNKKEKEVEEEEEEVKGEEDSEGGVEQEEIMKIEC